MAASGFTQALQQGSGFVATALVASCNSKLPTTGALCLTQADEVEILLPRLHAVPALRMRKLDDGLVRRELRFVQISSPCRARKITPGLSNVADGQLLPACLRLEASYQWRLPRSKQPLYRCQLKPRMGMDRTESREGCIMGGSMWSAQEQSWRKRKQGDARCPPSRLAGAHRARRAQHQAFGGTPWEEQQPSRGRVLRSWAIRVGAMATGFASAFLCGELSNAFGGFGGFGALNQTVTDALAEKGSLRAEWPGPSRIREPSTAMIAEGHLQGRFPGFRAVAKFKAPGHRSLVKERIPCSRRPRLQINHLPEYLESELRKKQAEETLRTRAHVPYRTGSAAVSFKVTARTNNECRRAQHSPGSRCVPRGLQLRLCLWQELRERPAVEGFEASRCQGVGSPDFTPSLKFLHRPCAAEARWAKAGSPRCSSVGGRYSEL